MSLSSEESVTNNLNGMKSDNSKTSILDEKVSTKKLVTPISKDSPITSTTTFIKDKKKTEYFESNILHKSLNQYTCQDLKVVRCINILLIGEKGVGKSSLLSTFHRALNNNYGQPPIAEIGENPTSAFTIKKRQYALNASGTIVGHDTRGLETLMQPELEQLKAIRDGRVKDNVEIKQKGNWGFWDYMYAIMSRNPSSILDPECLLDPTTDPETTIQHLPHGIIFVVPANQRKVPDELTEFVNLFTEYGYKPMFAVTKIDCHGGQSGDLYAATHRYDSKKEELMDLFDLEYDRVKPIQNYTQWERREASIESLALDLLNLTVRAGEEFIGNIIKKSKHHDYSSSSGMFSNCLLQ